MAKEKLFIDKYFTPIALPSPGTYTVKKKEKEQG